MTQSPGPCQHASRLPTRQQARILAIIAEVIQRTGDCPPLRDLAQLAERHHVTVMEHGRNLARLGYVASPAIGHRGPYSMTEGGRRYLMSRDEKTRTVACPFCGERFAC